MVSLIVSANQLAMCTCIIIAVLISHDVINIAMSGHFLHHVYMGK